MMNLACRLVDQLTHGSIFFGYKRSEGRTGQAAACERIVPVLCVRIFRPDGKCLVRTARNDTGTGLEDIQEVMSTGMETVYSSEWPGRACAMPDDICAAAANIAHEQANVPKDVLKFTVGEIVVAEPEDDKYLTIKCRYIRHFVNAQLKEPASQEIAHDLGLSEDGYVVRQCKHGIPEIVHFQWWDLQKCDEKLPGGASEAFRKLDQTSTD